MIFVEFRGCLLVRQSFFHDDSRNFADVGGGVTGVRGFHSSFRPTQAGLSLNMGIALTPMCYLKWFSPSTPQLANLLLCRCFNNNDPQARTGN